MDYYQMFSLISLPLGILILLLLLCRPLVLWYFKIPDMIERQDELIKELRIQNNFTKQRQGEAIPSPDLEEKKIAGENSKISSEKKMSFTELRYGKS